MRELFRRLEYLLHRRRMDRELAADMEFHRDMAGRAGGAPFGNTLRLREEARDAWGWTWIERLSQDLRYAGRMLRRSPGFALTAVLMLGIGIGISVAAFSFFNAFILKPLPVKDPETILRFQRVGPHSFDSDLPYPEMAFFREHSRTLSAVLAQNDAKVSVEGEERQANAGFVSADFFTELGSPAARGRTLDPANDDAVGAAPVIVLSYRFWRRHFGADPSAVGTFLRLNGKPARVIGVAAENFTGLSSGSVDFWLPIVQQPSFIDGSQLLTSFTGTAGVQMWGRLGKDTTARIAEDELKSLAAQLRQQYPDGIWAQERLLGRPGAYATAPHGHTKGTSPSDNDEVGRVAALLGGLSFLILAVACGNLGSLLLARGVARQREISIRTAVGAGSARLIRQLFTESLLLGMCGSLAGLIFGYGALRALMAYTEAPPWVSITPDWRVFSFAICLGFLAAILFGLTPALQIARQRQRTAIARHLLIGAQIAASCVLLIIAGLLVRALDRAMLADPGFDYQQVVSISPGLAVHGYSPARARAFLDEFTGRLRAAPGVESISLATIPPLGNAVATTSITVHGRPLQIHPNHVTPEFFQTMSIPLLRGRTLMPEETHAIVIGESLARLQFPGEDPIGKPLPGDDDDRRTSEPASDKDIVVGVVGTARVVQRENADAVEAYFPVAEGDIPSVTVLVKTSGPPEGLLPFLVSTARSIDPRVFPEMDTMKSSFRRKLSSTQSSAVVVSLLGAVALVLACFGIVGLVAYGVSQRTREIGIRMALGAKPLNVISAVLRQISLPVLAGLLVGTGAACFASRLLRAQLYGISTLDPVSYVVAIALFILVISGAALLPARRALRVDPLDALRHD